MELKTSWAPLNAASRSPSAAGPFSLTLANLVRISDTRSGQSFAGRSHSTMRARASPTCSLTLTVVEAAEEEEESASW